MSDKGFEKLWEDQQGYAHAQKHNEKLVECLKFYASDINWNETEPGFSDRIDSDDYNKIENYHGYWGGKRARQTLQEYEEQNEQK